MSILKDLYDGKLYPYAAISPSGPEYQQVEAKLENLYTSLIGKMPPETLDAFKEWEHLSQLSSKMQTYENFSYGFRLGVKLMHEAFSDGEPAEYNVPFPKPSFLNSVENDQP